MLYCVAMDLSLIPVSYLSALQLLQFYLQFCRVHFFAFQGMIAVKFPNGIQWEHVLYYSLPERCQKVERKIHNLPWHSVSFLNDRLELCHAKTGLKIFFVVIQKKAWLASGKPSLLSVDINYEI